MRNKDHPYHDQTFPWAGFYFGNISRIDAIAEHMIKFTLKEPQGSFLTMMVHVSGGYLGRIVELAGKALLFAHPRNPCTKALLSAIPDPDPDATIVPVPLHGVIPSPMQLPEGCVFNTRCPFADERCRTEIPALRYIDELHWVACHHAHVID